MRCVCDRLWCKAVSFCHSQRPGTSVWRLPGASPVTPRWHSMGELGAWPRALEPGVPTPVFAVVLLQPELSPSGE